MSVLGALSHCHSASTPILPISISFAAIPNFKYNQEFSDISSHGFHDCGVYLLLSIRLRGIVQSPTSHQPPFIWSFEFLLFNLSLSSSTPLRSLFPSFHTNYRRSYLFLITYIYRHRHRMSSSPPGSPSPLVYLRRKSIVWEEDHASC